MRRSLLWIGAAAFAFSCGEPAGPPREPPYLAIVALNDAPAGHFVGREYAYRVREASGTLGIDTVIRIAPRDTVILPVTPATYAVELVEGLPPSCRARYGVAQVVVVPAKSNTSLARYYLSCRALLSVEVFVEGTRPDSTYLYAITGPAAYQQSGVVDVGDTIQFDQMQPGLHMFTLGHVAAHCLVTSDGGTRQTVFIPDSGGAAAQFRVSCSDLARRPRILWAHASYRDGVSAFAVRVADPDRDTERYSWDITDCQRKSVLLSGGRTRRGLSGGRTAYADTATVIGAFEVGLPDAAMAGRCTALRIADEYGNSTPVLELPIGAGSGAPPVPAQFNARLVSSATMQAQLTVADPDNDYLGVFVGFRYRDGIMSPPDGQPDYGVYNAAGYLGTTIPDLRLPVGQLQYYDLLSLVVYLIDNRGNVTRVEDLDLLR